MDRDETSMAIGMMIVISILLLFAGFAHAQTPIHIMPPATIIVDNPWPKPSPTPNPCDFVLAAPADRSTVSAPIVMTIQVQGTSASSRWMNYYAGTYQTSGSLVTGSVTLPGPFIQDWTVVTATEMGAGVPSSCSQSVMVRVSNSTPTPIASATPTPTPTPTSTPTGTPSAFIADPAHPDNAVANNTVPTAAWMTTFKAAVANGLGPPGCPKAEPCEVPGPILQSIDPSYTGTTDQILAHYATVYGIDPDLMRADAMQETTNPPPGWHQGAIGDVGNGISLGILQIKSSDYPPTCPKVAQSQNTADVNDPSCMSHLSTSLTTAFRVAELASCMKGGAAGYVAHGRDFTSEGYAKAVANQDSVLSDACLGMWFSGGFGDPAGLQYASQVKAYYQSKPWLHPAVLQKLSLHKLTRPANRFARVK